MSENLQPKPELTISPQKIKARKGNFQVTINNRSNQSITYQLQAGDPGGLSDYSLDRNNVAIATGASAATSIDGKHPDFSAEGAPLTFGYMHSNGKASSFEVRVVFGIDDWEVKIIPRPAN